MAFFDERAQRVPHDPGRTGIGAVPRLDAVEHPIGMILGDVVEMVRDGFPHVERGIGLQRFEDRRGQLGVFNDGFEPRAPRQTRSAAFAREATHVFALVVGPGLQERERAGRIALDERPHGKLSRTKRRKKLQCIQRVLEIVEPVLRHEMAEAHIDEAVLDPRRDLAKDREFVAIVARQGSLGRQRSLTHAVHEFAPVEPLEGQREEFFPVKLRLDRPEFIGDLPIERGVEPVLKGNRGFLYGGHRGS